MINTVKEAIHGRYRLSRKKDAYILPNDIRVYPSNQYSYGFSLDHPTVAPFAFWSGSPPKDLAKMCDAIVVYSDGNDLICTLIEQKTGNPGECEKQLVNGKLFCQWLVSLCQQHNYTPKGQATYFGVLLWEPKPIPQKGTTTHQKPNAKRHDLFDKFFDIQNDTYVDVGELISSPLPQP